LTDFHFLYNLTVYNLTVYNLTQLFTLPSIEKRFHEKLRELAAIIHLHFLFYDSNFIDPGKNSTNFIASAPSLTPIPVQLAIMLIPKAQRKAIHEYIFREGVMVAPKDYELAKHPDVDVKNLYVSQISKGARKNKC
jgi:hypothetical protein